MDRIKKITPEEAAKRHAYYLENKERIKINGKIWRAKNRDKCRRYKAEWKAKNPDKFKKMMRDSKKRIRATPKGRVDCRIRERLREYFQSGTSLARIQERLGYTMASLASHLERQFLPGMSWANRSEWHIDHIVPLSSFTYSSPEDPEFRAAWALTNLRPLWAKANASKGRYRVHLL